MTRVLVLGGHGMLGHEIARVLSRDMDVVTAIRPALRVWPATLPGIEVVGGIDLTEADVFAKLFERATPDVVVNCAGIIKQKETDDGAMWRVNADLPVRLSRACAAAHLRLIHFSTDCVFSGRQQPSRPGGYAESHRPDPVDVYGQTKLEGERAALMPRCLTLRTSFIGREIAGHVSLVEWLLRQQGSAVRGFKHALFTGVSTTTMANLVEHLIRNHPMLAGLWHVSADPISKYELLRLFIERGRLDIQLTPDEQFFCDRRLDSARFSAATGWRAPGWPEMVDDVLSQPLHSLGMSPA